MAPSPRSSAGNRPLRNSNTPPSLARHPSYNQRNASEPASSKQTSQVDSPLKNNAGSKGELSKRMDSLMARTKEYEARLDNLASKKTSTKNKSASAHREKKLQDSASKENEKNIEKGRRKDCEEAVIMQALLPENLLADEKVVEEAPKKILAPNNLTSESNSGNSAFKPVSGRERKTSILKKKSVDESSAPISILKHKEEEVASLPQSVIEIASPKPQSILKKKSSLDEPSYEERSTEELEDEPQGILKRKSSARNKRHTILKKKSFEELSTEESVEPRPILKKRASTDDEMLSSNDSEKPRPILKSGRRSAEGEDSNYSSAATSPARRSPSVNVEDGIIRNQVNLQLRFNQPEVELSRSVERYSFLKLFPS